MSATAAARPPGHAWLAALCEPPAAQAWQETPGVRRLQPDPAVRSNRLLLVVPGSDGSMPEAAVLGRLVVVVDGTIHNLPDLAAQAGIDPASGSAAIVAHHVARDGAAAVRALEGEFCLIVWDTQREHVWAARDPLGMWPLYRATTDEAVTFSPTLPALARWPGVTTSLDPVVLAEYLSRRYSSHEETVFTDIRRVPPGTIVSMSERGAVLESQRYWDPAPADRPIEWLTESEVNRFEERFERSVRRAMGSDRAGVYLSGGLDSISVAALCADLSVRSGRPAPMALSLEFPPPSTETPVQQGVARGLGLDQVLVPLSDAVGPDGLIAAALEMGSSWPVPMLTVWNPAYAHLAALGAAAGCGVILTGRGGDESLTLSPLYAADLISRGDGAGLVRLLVSLHRSYASSRLAVLRRGLVTYGVRPIAARASAALAPGAWRRHHIRRAAAEIPPWAAAHPDIRQALERRTEARLVPEPAPYGYYVREMRRALLHPLIGYDLEESFEMGRRQGVRLRHPFWDAPLVEFLCRVPPSLLARRRAKWLVRDTIARRFPGLGLERQRKVLATDFFRDLLSQEAPRAWRRLGGASRLGALGVVDRAALDAAMPALLQAGRITELARVWEIMNLETWVRHQQ